MLLRQLGCSVRTRAEAKIWRKRLPKRLKQFYGRKAAKASDPTARGRGSSNRQKALRRQFFVDDADEDADGVLRWKIPKLAWHRLCREVLDELGAKDLRLPQDSASILLIAAESVMVQLFADGKALSEHGKRSTVYPEDLQLALSLRRSWGDLSLASSTRNPVEASTGCIHMHFTRRRWRAAKGWRGNRDHNRDDKLPTKNVIEEAGRRRMVETTTETLEPTCGRAAKRPRRTPASENADPNVKMLTIALMALYYDDVAAGRKSQEIRADVKYWRDRLEGKTHLRFTRGYTTEKDKTLIVKIVQIQQISAMDSEHHGGPRPGTREFKKFFKTAESLLLISFERDPAFLKEQVRDVLLSPPFRNAEVVSMKGGTWASISKAARKVRTKGTRSRAPEHLRPKRAELARQLLFRNDVLKDPESGLSQADIDASVLYFGTLPETMLSLFMSICGGVSWENVLAPLKSMSVIWVLLYLFYIAFTYFAVMNVVTAVFCQSAIDGAQNDHASKVHAILSNKEEHLGKIRALFSQFGAEDGVITFDLFREKIKSPEVRHYFQTLGLDVWDAWSFFKLLDEDAGGVVEIEEFLMGCLRLRGQATAMDVGKIINDQQWLIRNQ
ncbi:unnamed protein product, partial [Symbiodinium sp. KB8]